MTSTTANGPAAVDVVAQGIREHMHPEGKLNTLSISDDGTHGVVLWQRPEPREQRYVVHRWATTYTDGQPVKGGVMFWSGGYYGTLSEAADDLKERA